MSESQYFCPRLIDYLAIVGAHPNSSKKSSLYQLQNNSTNNEEVQGGIGSTAESCNTEDNFYIQVLLFLLFYSIINVIVTTVRLRSVQLPIRFPAIILQY